MNQSQPISKQELIDFITTNKTSQDNKNLWLELWDRGFMVLPVGQLHIGEIDYLVVTCAPPALEPRQALLGNPN